jgi:cytochrome c
MIKRALLTAVVLSCLTAPAFADLQLAIKNGCTACHSVDNKIVGPAWKDVANKNRNDKGAYARLVAKVKAGGSGVWGPVAMPANSPRVSDADIKSLVKWILTLH